MSEELDELASAYADGEATAEEQARVESTPELLDLVDELRSVRVSSLDLPAPDPAVKSRHLAAALEVFDELHEAAPSGLAAASTPVAEASRGVTAEGLDNGARPGQGPTDDDATDTTVVPMRSRSKRRTPPAWMLNAAAAVVIVGGIGFALTQLPSDSDDTAADAIADDGELAEESFDAASSSNATSAAIERDEFAGDAPSADEATAGDDATEDDAMEDDAMDEEAMGDAMEEAESGSIDEDSADTDDSDSASDEETEPAPRAPLFSVPGDSTATEALSEFDAQFGDEMLTPPPHPCQDLIDSLVNPATGTMLGSVEVDYGGELADLVVLDTGGDRGALLVNPAGCSVLSSS